MKNSDDSKPAPRQGTVKWFDEKLGYGFIEQENGRDLFVHYKELRGKLNAGDRVEYILGEGRKGPAATKVRVVSRAVVASEAVGASGPNDSASGQANGVRTGEGR